MGNNEFSDFDSLFFVHPAADTYDPFLREYAALTGTYYADIPRTPWTARAFADSPQRICNFNQSEPKLVTALTYSTTHSNSYSASHPTSPATSSKPKQVQQKRPYKPAARKYRPVPTYLPDTGTNHAQYHPIPPPEPLELPTNPPPRASLKCGTRLTRDRLDDMFTRIEPNILSEAELNLLAWIVVQREQAFAWEHVERGSFSREYFDDYEIPVIEHTPWQRKPIIVPNAILDAVKQEIYKGDLAG